MDLDPTREQAGKRPALVISTNGFNKSRADLVVVVPITSKDKGIPWHVPLQPPEGGGEDQEFHHVRSGSIGLTRPDSATLGHSLRRDVG